MDKINHYLTGLLASTSRSKRTNDINTLFLVPSFRNMGVLGAPLQLFGFTQNRFNGNSQIFNFCLELNKIVQLNTKNTLKYFGELKPVCFNFV